MPTPLIIPNALQVVVSGTNLGTNWVNTFGLVADGAFLLDQTVADDIAEAFRAPWFALRPALNLGWSAEEVLVRDLRTGTSPTIEADFAPFSGSNPGQAMPPHLAIVASHSTGFRGRSYRGRTYLNGFTEASNDADGTVLAVTRDEILTFFSAIKTNLAALTSGGFDLAVLSRVLLEANAITNTTVDDEWDRQDRRKRQ